jgi:hypothetical protein
MKPNSWRVFILLGVFILVWFTVNTGCNTTTPDDIIDRTPPQIKHHNPSDGETDVPLDVTLTITFDESMNIQQGFVRMGGHILSNEELSWNTDHTECTITPDEHLPSDSTIFVQLIEFEDQMGNILNPPYHFRFSTIYVDPCFLDSTVPSVTSEIEDPILIPMGRTSFTIPLTFNKPVYGVSEALTISTGSIESVLGSSDSYAITLVGFNQCVDGTIQLTIENTVTDMCGHSLEPTTITFHISADSSPPFLTLPADTTLTVPFGASNTTFDIRFSETVVGVPTAITSPDASITSIVGSDDSYQISMSGFDFCGGGSYTLQMGSSIHDSCGNSFIPIDLTIQVSSVTTDPTLLEPNTTVEIPAYQATYSFDMLFSQEITMGIPGAVSSPTASIDSVSGSGAAYQVDISGLDYCTGGMVSVDLGAGIGDPCGGMLTPTSINLYVPPDSGIPTLISPIDTQFMDSSNSSVILSFNKPMNLSLSDFQDSGFPQSPNTVTGILAIDSHTYRLLLDTSGGTPPYFGTIQLLTSAQDVCGNALPAAVNIDIQMVDCTSTSSPMVISDLVTDIMDNYSVYRLEFDQPVDPVDNTTIGITSLIGTGSINTIQEVFPFNHTTYEIQLADVVPGDRYEIHLTSDIQSLPCSDRLNPSTRMILVYVIQTPPGEHCSDVYPLVPGLNTINQLAGYDADLITTVGVPCDGAGQFNGYRDSFFAVPYSGSGTHLHLTIQKDPLDDMVAVLLDSCSGSASVVACAIGYGACGGAGESHFSLLAHGLIPGTYYLMMSSYSSTCAANKWPPPNLPMNITIQEKTPTPDILINSDTIYTTTVADVPSVGCTQYTIRVSSGDPIFPQNDFFIYPDTSGCGDMGSGGADLTLEIPIPPAASGSLRITSCGDANPVDSSIWVGTSLGLDDVGCDGDGGSCPVGLYSSELYIADVSGYAGTSLFATVDEWEPQSFWEQGTGDKTITVEQCP